MKKSTLLLVLLALVFGGFVYYYEFKRKPATQATDEVSKPAFTFQAVDVTGITLLRGGQTITAQKTAGEWVITQPVQTRADQGALESIAADVSSARVSRTLSTAPERLSAYGLSKPTVTLELHLKNGTRHRLQLGAKDFSGISVYALTDDSPSVEMLPATILTVSDKPLDELRDRSVLGFSEWDVTGFGLKNQSGEVQAVKQGTNWKIRKPRDVAADSSQVSSFLSQVSAAKLTEIVSETASAKDLARYGLARPVISFQVKLEKGGERALLVGEKAREQFYARDTSRPMVFRIDQALEQRLESRFFDLREKAILHFELSELTRVQIRNSHQTLVAERDVSGNWKIQLPADQKGKQVESNRFLDPLQNARAAEIFDSPPAAIAARLGKSAVEVELTDKSGKTTKISFSAASGDKVYVRTTAGATVFQVGKQIFDDLNFKLSDIVF